MPEVALRSAAASGMVCEACTSFVASAAPSILASVNSPLCWTFHSKRCGPGTGTASGADSHDAACHRGGERVQTATRIAARLPNSPHCLTCTSRTLQAAARTGRLGAQLSVRSVFGRPTRSASIAVGERFLAIHYTRFGGQTLCAPPLLTVPA